MGENLGIVEANGNANGKASHLHYSIITLLPYLGHLDSNKQGWKKIIYLYPLHYFKNKLKQPKTQSEHSPNYEEIISG